MLTTLTVLEFAKVEHDHLSQKRSSKVRLERCRRFDRSFSEREIGRIIKAGDEQAKIRQRRVSMQIVR
jgi:hypothetical protein